MTLPEAKRAAEQLAGAGVFQVHFGGGEPFLYPGFMDLLRHARGAGLGCLCISTNGSSLAAGRIAELEALGGVYLQISLDGSTEQSCDAIRGPGAFRRACAALRRLAGSDLVSTVNFVYTRANAHQLAAMDELARGFGATLRVTRLKPSGRGAASYAALRPSQPQLAALHKWLGENPDVLTGDTFFHLNPLGGKPLPGFQFCGAARLTCLIAPNGDVFPCAFTQAGPLLGGNLRRTPFAEIWRESEVFNGVFRAAQPGACGSCGSYRGCGGGCPAVKESLLGRMDLPDPDCVLGQGVPSHAPLCQG